MGLDMYLYRVPKGFELTREKDFPDNSECCYWRKANQVRYWIVKHTNYDEESYTVKGIWNATVYANCAAV